MSNQTNHIFFDLDHTLWDFEKNSTKTFEHIFKLNKMSIDIQKFLNYYVSINNAYWRLFRNDKVSKEALRYGRLKDTFDKIKFPISDDLINKLSEDYITHLSSFNYLFDGAIEILDYLKPKYTLHIITNGFSEVQYKKLSNSKIDIYFDTVITSEAVGVKKPNPKIFKYALQQAGAKIKESVMIGDNWEADIMGAKNYGMNVIFCNFENESVDESIQSIQHLLELKKYL
ncbi:MAG: noncanonical pyrimidine nucleotidase, YjjG family [Flavobacteriaceae bacterium]|nr:MAG: noncanonical pyrimidine nucleotidase, YjjG family [Flavobacteriaceae bacterium]